MLIDDFLLTYHVTERHSTKVNAPIRQVYDAITVANLLGSPIVRGLFFLRGLPARLLSPKKAAPAEPAMTIEGFTNGGGFVLLGENPPHEYLIGTIQRFWAVVGSSGVSPLSGADAFDNFDTPGFAKSVMGFTLTALTENQTRLATETRVFCLDEQSRRQFRRYWFFIAPFSGLIRRIMLRAIKREAEKGRPGNGSN